MSEPIFKIENVSKSFGDHAVLKNINLQIQPGEIIGIIGASGAGKTTFLNTIIGFVKPDEGDVLYRQGHLLSYKDNFIYKSVYKRQSLVKQLYGFASQIPSFYEELTTKENLEYFGLLHNLNRETIKANTSTLLNLMDLGEARDVKAKYLSGGMERRLDIGCSLMHDPDVLILDEPTSDLDPLLRSHIWELVKKINQKGTTIILSSHHLIELEELCDRVAIIKEGELVALAKPEELKKEFALYKEIIIQVQSQKYAEIAQEISSNKATSTTIKDNTLRIKTKNPEKSIVHIMSILKRRNEQLTFIKVSGASLDDVFLNIWDEKHKRGKDEV